MLSRRRWYGALTSFVPNWYLDPVSVLHVKNPQWQSVAQYPCIIHDQNDEAKGLPEAAWSTSFSHPFWGPGSRSLLAWGALQSTATNWSMFFPMQFTSLCSIYPFWYWHGHMPSCLLCLDSMKEPPHLTYDQILQDACSAPTRTARKLNRKVRWVKVVHGSMFDFSQMVNRLAGAEASS